MTDSAPVLSVVVCAHNPKREYLERALAALRAQTLPMAGWELVVIDNASVPPLAEWLDLRWHPRAAVRREETLGLAAARLRAFRETAAAVLVFVDDDNVLAPDYLARAAELAEAWPMLGAWGTGWCVQEFETPPPAELAPYLYCLGRIGQQSALWSNFADTYRSAPIGAGLCVRRSVAETYAGYIGKNPARGTLERTGKILLSGADWDLALTAVDIGLGTGRFPELKMTHLIKRERLDPGYLLRLHFGISYSMTLINHHRGTLRRPYLENRVAQWLGEFRLRGWARKFARATRAGAERAWDEIQAARKR